MQAIITRYHQWATRRRQRKWRRLIENHYMITKTGSSLWGRAVRIYEDKTSFRKIRLVRIQLHIELLTGTKAIVMTKCLLHNNISLEGRMIRFKFIPGDLSQIVLHY